MSTKDTQMFSFRIPTQLKADLDLVAKRRAVDTSSLIKGAIAEYLLNAPELSDESIDEVCAASKLHFANEIKNKGNFVRTSILDTLRNEGEMEA